MIIQTATDVRGYFHERLGQSLQRLEVSVDEETELYLVELLSRPEASALATPETPLVERWKDALEAESERERLRHYQHTGDAALYTCGFFGDHIAKRGMSREYYITMGGRAYLAASQLAGRRRDTFEELGHRFEPLVRVLDEVREETVLRTPQDIVRLYDRWRKTQSPTLAERLHSAGVFPSVPKPGTH